MLPEAQAYLLVASEDMKIKNKESVPELGSEPNLLRQDSKLHRFAGSPPSGRCYLQCSQNPLLLLSNLKMTMPHHLYLVASLPEPTISSPNVKTETYNAMNENHIRINYPTSCKTETSYRRPGHRDSLTPRIPWLPLPTATLIQPLTCGWTHGSWLRIQRSLIIEQPLTKSTENSACELSSS